MISSKDINIIANVLDSDLVFNPQEKKHVDALDFKIEMTFENNVYKMKLPHLFNKTKNKNLYFTSALNKLFNENIEFFMSANTFKQAMIVIEHHVKESETIICDADNINTKSIIDKFNGILYYNDTVDNLSLLHMYVPEKENEDSEIEGNMSNFTIVNIMDIKDFPNWTTSNSSKFNSK